MASLAKRLQSPWRDRSGRFSWLKAVTLALLFFPAAKMITDALTGTSGPLAVIYFTYWSGVFATGVLLASLAVTPVRRIFGWGQFIIVRRMIGIAGLAYTGLHFYFYIALCRFDVPFILQGATDPSLVIATISTLGLIALGATSFDAAIARLGGKSWNRLHGFIHIFVALGIAHFLLSPGETGGIPFLMTGIFLWLMGWRLLDRIAKGSDTRALLGLAILVPALNLAFQLAWVAVYQKVAVAETLANTFAFQYDPDTFGGGIDSTWQVLILGLLMALLPVALRRQPGLRGRLAARPERG